MGSGNSKVVISKQKTCDKSIPSNFVLRRHLSLNNKSCDRFTLIWLDENCQNNSPDSLHTIILLQEISNNQCLIFDKSNLFLSEIDKLKIENRKILVVISGLFATEILSKISQSISTIIIFCRNYQKYSNLKKIYTNITDICIDYKTLKYSIESELISLKFHLFSEQIFKSIIPLSLSQNINNNGPYYSYISFIEILKQMPQTEKAKELMLNKCTDYCRYAEKERECIDEFRHNYKSDQAINWYIKDSFVYRLVNRAFRSEDVVLWYIFRFYVVDLIAQLEKIHKEQNIENSFIVYRGQAYMPINEFETLKQGVTKFISVNGFFSSSRDINMAKQFLFGAVDTDEFKVVIFEITIDGSSLKNTIFVDIDQYTGQSYESEILFNIGSVFEVENVVYELEWNAWKIKLKATDQFTKEIKEQTDKIKKKFQNGNINLLFGRFLIDTMHLTKAESYFQMMLQNLPYYHQDLPLVYDNLGHINMERTYWKEALKYFNLSYELKKNIFKSNHPNIAITLNNIGRYYQAIQDYDQAHQFYLKSLLLLNKNDENIYIRAIIQRNLSTIHALNHDYDQALNLCIEACQTLQGIHSVLHTEIVFCYATIGDIHLAKTEYDKAQDFYFAAYDISEKILFIGDRLRNDIIKAIIDLYKKQGMRQKAIDFVQYHLSIYEEHLPANHINIASLLIKIAELFQDNDNQKINTLTRALHILEKHSDLEYVTRVTCLILIAKYHYKQNEYDNALRYYDKALEIQEKIYPEKHSLLMKTRSLINKIIANE